MTWSTAERLRSAVTAVSVVSLAWGLGLMTPARLAAAPPAPDGACVTPARTPGLAVDHQGKPVADVLLVGARGEVARSGPDGRFVVAEAVSGPLWVFGAREEPRCPARGRPWTVEVEPSEPWRLVVEAPAGGTAWLRAGRGPAVGLRSGEPFVVVVPDARRLVAYADGAQPMDVWASGTYRLEAADTIPLVVTADGPLPPALGARDADAPVRPDGTVDLVGAGWWVAPTPAAGWALAEPVRLVNLPGGPRYALPWRWIGEAPSAERPIRAVPAPPVDVRCAGTPDQRCAPWVPVSCVVRGVPQPYCHGAPGAVLQVGHHRLALTPGQTSAWVDLTQDAVVDVDLGAPDQLVAVNLDEFDDDPRTADCSREGACRLYGMAPGRWRLVRGGWDGSWSELMDLGRIADGVVPEGSTRLRWEGPGR